MHYCDTRIHLIYPNSSYKSRATYSKRLKILAKKMFITCEPMVQSSSVRPFWKAYNVSSNISYSKYTVLGDEMKLAKACLEGEFQGATYLKN